MKLDILKKAFRDTLPIMAGYVVLGAGFGMLMQVNGYSVWWALAMSLFIYAGSMQYIAVGLLTGGASLLSTALTTLMVNARHLFYGISMIERYKDAGAKKPYLIFGLTDETYSVVCHGKGSTPYYFAVTALDQAYWVAGTALGSLLGAALPFSTEGVDFALTALFVTVFTDQWLSTKRHFPALCGVGTAVCCLVLFGADNFLIPTMIALTAVFLAMGAKEKNAEKGALTHE